MALRGKVPTAVQKRLKMMVFGAPGSGKTFSSLMFPSPYLIDTERGAENDQYVELLSRNNGAIFQSSDFEDVYKEISALVYEKHDYKTLIIDPVTVIYNKLLEDSALKVGDQFGRHYGAANKRMQSLFNLLLRLDMNIIVTAHTKNEYGENLQVLDKTFDGWKKLDYLFDLVFDLRFKDKNRFAIVKKSRMGAFPIGEQFPFSYDEIKKRYNGKSLEDQAAQAEKVSEDALKNLKVLITDKKVPEETIEKWLNKASVNSIEEFTEDQVKAIIVHLEK